MTIEEIRSLINSISRELGNEIKKDDVEIYDRGLPHNSPKHLTKNHRAVYLFLYGDEYLKIGKVNENSNARYTTGHYGFNHPSTLAKSIIRDEDFAQTNGINEFNVADWIKQNCRRIDIEISSILYDEFAVSLIEIILQYKLRPKYEGKTA